MTLNLLSWKWVRRHYFTNTIDMALWNDWCLSFTYTLAKILKGKKVNEHHPKHESIERAAQQRCYEKTEIVYSQVIEYIWYLKKQALKWVHSKGQGRKL